MDYNNNNDNQFQMNQESYSGGNRRQRGHPAKSSPPKQNAMNIEDNNQQQNSPQMNEFENTDPYQNNHNSNPNQV